MTAVATLLGLGSLALRTRSPQLGICAQSTCRSHVLMGSRERDASERRELLRGTAALAAASTIGELPLPRAEAASSLNKASSAGSQVNKDPESLLRYGLPIDCKDARALQKELEEAKPNAAKQLWSKAQANVKTAKGLLNSKRKSILAAVPSDRQDRAEKLYDAMVSGIEPLQEAVNSINLDGTVSAQEAVVRSLGELEELMVAKFPFEIPDEYKNLPKLLGRGTVELTLTRGPNSEEKTFDVDGDLKKSITVVMLLDGYNAPITAGNFMDLVKKGFYNKMEIQRSDGFVVQTGDPRKGEEPDPSEPNGYVENGEVRKIPLEVFPAGLKAPIYGATFDDEGYAGAAATLPFQAYGALGMAREEYEPDSASSQWFWLLFDSDLTPAGAHAPGPGLDR